ncbi:MAG: L-arabinose isomerase, partial [Oscillospiraceae bacterium]|nr:L-arabinose isomerase [Oscillospiraceae bacterium]
GGEGDWKTAALTHIMKVMGEGKGKGTSFMEDYTYDLTENQQYSLGAHMLEVCPTIAAATPKVEVHSLSIGGKEPPARLVFEGKAGKAILATIVDMGNRFRMIVHDIECVKPIYEMPNLPVARVMWRAEPNFATGTECWIIAGGAHHSVLSYDVTAEQMKDFARILGVEFVHIHANTEVNSFEDQITLLNAIGRFR